MAGAQEEQAVSDDQLKKLLGESMQQQVQSSSFPGRSREWVQLYAQGDAKGAEESLRQFLVVPSDFVWTALAYSMPMDQKETEDFISRLNGAFSNTPVGGREGALVIMRLTCYRVLPFSAPSLIVLSP